MTTYYYTSSLTRALYRATETGDRVFLADGGWVPDDTLMDWRIGEENTIEQVTDADARSGWPEAF